LAKDLHQLREENRRLRQENAQLKRVNAEQQAALAALRQQLELLQEQFALLKKAFFAPRRERFLPSPDQKLLFEPQSLDGDAAGDAAEPPATEEADEEPPAAPRPRRARRERFCLPQCLPVERHEYALSDEELDERFGPGQWRVIDRRVSRQLEMTPAAAYVREEVVFVYGAKSGSDRPTVVTTPRPPKINEKGIFGARTIAYLAEAKFARHLPLYRLQEELRSASTLWFNRSALCGALTRAAQRLAPLYDLLQRSIRRSAFLRVDETTARVLRPGTGKTALAYLWVYVGDDDHPYQWFDYRLDRSRAGPAEALRDYAGGLLTDGYSAYASLVDASQGRLLDLGCWAHVRRKFDEACIVTAHRLAHEALAWIWQLYDLEDQYAAATPAERGAARQRTALPILQRLHGALRQAQGDVRPSSKLAEAIGYCLNRWDALVRYTSDGCFPIDNNAAERALRPAVIGRKNYLFFGSDEGGCAAAVWYSLIDSARRNCVRVLPYLGQVAERLPRIVPEYLRRGDDATAFDSLSPEQIEALEELLPDRWIARNPQHRCDDRQRELDEKNRRRRETRGRRRCGVNA